VPSGAPAVHAFSRSAGRLRVLSSPASVGPADVTTEIARTGRRVATGEARLLQEGQETVRAVASFTDLTRATGRMLVLGDMPELPPPDAAVDLLGQGSIPGLTITDRVEYRLPAMPGWTEGRPTGDPSVRLWMRFKEPRDPDLLTLPLLVDAAFPAVMEIGELDSSTIELTVHLRAHPAPGWLACRVATRYVIGGYHEEDFEIWDSAGRIVAHSRQLALLPSAAPPS
jgi:acyl-CoA thioesterase